MMYLFIVSFDAEYTRFVAANGQNACQSAGCLVVSWTTMALKFNVLGSPADETQNRCDD